MIIEIIHIVFAVVVVVLLNVVRFTNILYLLTFSLVRTVHTNSPTIFARSRRYAVSVKSTSVDIVNVMNRMIDGQINIHIFLPICTTQTNVLYSLGKGPHPQQSVRRIFSFRLVTSLCTKSVFSDLSEIVLSWSIIPKEKIGRAVRYESINNTNSYRNSIFRTLGRHQIPWKGFSSST